MEITIKASNVCNPYTGETTSSGWIRIKASEEHMIISVREEQAKKLIGAIINEVRKRGKEVAYSDEKNGWLIRWKLGDITVEYVGEDSWSRFEAISLRF